MPSKPSDRAKRTQSNGLKILTPLGIIGSFLSLTEVVAGIAATKTTGAVQTILIVFVCAFPLVVAGAFFRILWARPHVFYPPAEFGSFQDVTTFVEAMRSNAQAGAPSATQQTMAEPETPALPEAVVDTKAAEATKDTKDKPAPAPKTPSTPDELDLAMIMAFINKKSEEAEKMYSALMVAETDPIKKDKHEVFHAYLQYTHAKQAEGLTQLERLSKEPRTRSQASFYLGVLYDRIKEFDKAIEAYRVSVETAEADLKPSRIVSLARAHVAAGHIEPALAILSNALKEFPDKTHQALLYEGIAAVYAAIDNDEMRALALELAIDCDPHNSDLRFRAAFSYSKQGLRDLALFHYTAQLAVKPNEPNVLNNLGVEYQNLGMPIKAVTHYRRAFQNKETLAGSNLAYLFMNAGFSKEAKEILDEAKSEKDPHPNVATAISTLAERTENEQANTTKVLDRALREQTFLKEYARLRLRTLSDDFAGTWKNSNAEILQIVCEDGKLTATWTFDKAKKELSGTIINKTAKVRLRVTPDDWVFKGGMRDVDGYAYTSLDGQRLQWMLFDNHVPEFAQLMRVVAE